MAEERAYRSGSRKERRSKKNKKMRVFLSIFMVICIAVIGFCAYKIYSIYHEYSEGDKANEALSEYIVVEREANKETNVLDVDFNALGAINEDVCGWLYLKDTPINFPVVQGADNEFYLTHNFQKEKNSYGAAFIDVANQSDFSDPCTIIYGHRMNNGAMFAELLQYEKQEYYDAHPYLLLVTPEHKYKLEVFSARRISADLSNYKIRFDSDEQYISYLQKIVSDSFVKTDVTMSSEDRYVMLSTCVKGNESVRFVVYAKISPLEEGTAN